MKYFPFLMLLLFSCEKKDPELTNEEELITTLIYRLTPENGGNAVEFKFQDLDGEGGISPVVSAAVLMANSVYNGELILINESVTPAESISEEVLEEAEEHQFFYNYNSNNLSISYNDKDANMNPVGLKTKLTTKSPSSSTLKITLKHQPNKNAMGVSDGQIQNAGGETDIEVEFNVKIQ